MLSKIDSVSFIADVVMLNISLCIIPPNHPCSKIFSQKVIRLYFHLTSNFIVSPSKFPRKLFLM
jgi:hypothetical protein